MKTTLLLSCGFLLLAGCNREAQPTVEDARKFLADAEDTLLTLGVEDQQADWVHENFITDDTEAVSARADQRAIDESVKLAKEATQVRQAATAGGDGSQDEAAEDRSGAGDARRSEGERGGHASWRLRSTAPTARASIARIA